MMPIQDAAFRHDALGYIRPFRVSILRESYELATASAADGKSLLVAAQSIDDRG